MKKFVTLLLLGLLSVVTATAQTVSVDDIFTNQGSQITIPINISDVTGNGLTSAEFVLEYDTTMLNITGVTAGNVVTDPNALLLPNNTVSGTGTGEYRVAISTTSPFVGSGTIATVSATVKNFGQTGLNLTNTLLNGAAATTNNGTLDTSVPVSIAGPDKLDQGATGTYTVSVGDLNGRDISSYQFAITFDNSLLNVDVNSISTSVIMNGLTTVNNVVGNTIFVSYGSETVLSGNGALFTFDATATTTSTGTSVFNFTDVQFNNNAAGGKVSNIVTTPAVGVLVEDFVFITLEGASISKTLNNQTVVNINASDLTSEEVLSYQFELDYPSAGLKVDSVVFLNDLNITQQGTFSDINGRISGAANATQFFQGQGTLAKVYFTNIAKGIHNLSFNSFLLNTGSPVSSTGTLALTVDNDAPSSPVILIPGAGDTVNVAGLPTDSITPTWSASIDANNDTLNYTWQLATSMDFSTVLLAVNASTDTSIVLTNTAVENLLKSNGVSTGQNITLYHRAIVSDADATVTGAGSAAVFSLGVVNTPIVAGNITAPADGDTVTVAGLPTDSVDITWSAGVINDVDDDVISYTWQLATDMAFTNIVTADSNLTSAMTSRTNAELEALLGANDTLTVYHRVIYSDGESTDATSATAMFIKGVVNTPVVAGNILSPADGDTVTVQGLPTDSVNITWEAFTANDMDDVVSYTWQLATDMAFTNIVTADSNLTSAMTSRTNAELEALLGANDTLTVYHRVIYSDGESTATTAATAMFIKGVVNTPVVAGNILSPVTGDTVNVQGLPTDLVEISWSSTMINDQDDDVLSYTWELSTDSAFTSVADTYTGSDTTISRTNAQLVALLSGSDTTTVYHRVIYSDSESTASSSTEMVVFITGVINTPPMATNITAPADSAIVLVEGLPTATISPMWTSAMDADGDSLNYNWQLSADSGFSTTLADLAVGADTMVNLTLATVDAILETAGLNIGDTVRVYHRANVTDGIVTTNGNSATAWFIRGLVNTPPTSTEITVPAEGAEITIQGDPTAPFVPRWTEATDADGDNVSYIWQLSTSFNFSSESILVEFTVNETQVELTIKDVADLLDAAGVQPGVPVTLYHRAQSTDGKVTVNGVSKSVSLVRGTLTNIDSELPVEFALDQNYPNPFNPVTTINYSVAESRMVSVKIYDMLGREVATLVNEVQPAGNYSIPFDAARLSTGIYIYRMVSGDFVHTRKMTLMK